MAEEQAVRSYGFLDHTSVWFSEGYHVWSQSGRRILLQDGQEQRLSGLVKLVLGGHLRHSYDVVDDVAPLRVFTILQANFPDRCKDLEKICREQQTLQDGKMREALLRFIYSDFRRAIEDMSRQLGWTVEDVTCNSVFLDRVADHLGVSRDSLMQDCMAVTPCLDVRDTPPYKICKSNINLVDLFQVIACGGKDVIGLRQKNNCSIALLAPVHASGAKYAFEIGGIFDIGGKCFVYLTNGIIVNMTSKRVMSINKRHYCDWDSQGGFKITDVAIACRFGMSHGLVKGVMKDKDLIGDHCSIDSGNHTMWNLRAATQAEQNENRTGRLFQFQTLQAISKEDPDYATYLRDSFRIAFSRGLVRPLLRPESRRKMWLKHQNLRSHFCTDGSDDDVLGRIASGQAQYARLTDWGRNKPVFYFSTETDTILCKGSLSSIEAVQFMSHRYYFERICTVSDLAAQKSDMEIGVNGGEYSLSRSIAFSDAYYQTPIMTPCGKKWVQVANSSGDELHVHHLNDEQTHNYSSNLEIIPDLSNNSLQGRHLKSRNKIYGATGISFVMEKRSDRLEASWQHAFPCNAMKVSSFRNALDIIDSVDIPLALRVSEWTPSVHGEPEYQFQLFCNAPDFLGRRVQCSIFALYQTCIDNGISVPPLNEFQKGLLAGKPRSRRLKPGERIERLSDNGDVVSRLFLS